MKYLVLILILALNIQPLQAGVCDMESEQAMTHHAAQDSGSEDDTCCAGLADSPVGCEHAFQCSFSTVFASLLPALSNLKLSIDNPQSGSLATSQLTPSHSSPPFRPPIS